MRDDLSPRSIFPKTPAIDSVTTGAATTDVFGALVIPPTWTL